MHVDYMVETKHGENLYRHTVPLATDKPFISPPSCLSSRHSHAPHLATRMLNTPPHATLLATASANLIQLHSLRLFNIVFVMDVIVDS
jgi:hypothetical protein